MLFFYAEYPDLVASNRLEWAMVGAMAKTGYKEGIYDLLQCYTAFGSAV